MAPNDYKTRKEIAELYPISYSTLKKLGMAGRVDGPPIIRIGDLVLYHLPTFEKWLQSYLVAPGANAPLRRRGRPRKDGVSLSSTVVP